MLWFETVKNPFQLQKRLKNDPKISIFQKILNDLKNVSRHCGGHYNIKIKHFEDFSGGGAPPMSNRVKFLSQLKKKTNKVDWQINSIESQLNLIDMYV